jgi:hypothetical protein
MTIHEKHALVCIESLVNEDERNAVVTNLTTGPGAVEILELSFE